MLKWLPSTLFLFFFTLTIPVFGQQLDHVQGELLVKLWPEVDQSVKSWAHSKRSLNGRTTGAKYDRLVSAPMDIHAITFNHTEVNEIEFLRALQSDPKVQAVQFNHFVTLRNQPDDPQFDDQWQYINTGQSGGTPGADIDIDLAWDIATGGLTSDGDTIVACVIDDGINLNHPDIMANLWVNHAEIPNNNIDDDGNGFVDDYRGWDTGSNNDGVGDGGGHGTPVAGIVGAVGNNGVGVAGVNWAVKLMIVQGGSGVESEVLEAYSYPLVARQKYNATNGQEGAFVVSTNASWGIDLGQPANAPLWCAFYDTLGVHGILSCGATANANFNIDEVGDLPTGCSSEYLITVTNMNDDDVKVNSAGYGIETIDLGAFGQGTWTTSFNSYGGFGGTSGATPHVTGTIALLYSAPCSNLSAIAKSDPQYAAELVRDYILDGVDPNPSLDGITVTGGRLNVNNAMLSLMANCGPCPAPAALSVGDLTDGSANVSWITTDSVISANLQYRLSGTTDWTTIEDASSPFTLDGLEACTEYDLQVYGVCSSDTSFTPELNFKTDGCCENPTLTISDVTETTATVSWPSVLAALSYNVRVSVTGAGTWTEVNTTDTQFALSDLIPCTEYEVQIQVVCSGGAIDYSASSFLKTFGCGACTDLQYCSLDQASVEDEWIESVVVGDLANISGPNDSYGDFTNGGPTAEFSTFATYDVTLTPGYAGNQFSEGFRIWIDLNQNGFFTANEMMFSSDSPASGITSGSITIPGAAVPGFTRMRIVMSFANLPTSCDFSSDFGEAEDYCVTIVEGVAPCDVPNGLVVDNVTTSSAELSWSAATGATEYVVRHKKTSETDWTENTVSSTNSTFTGLDDGTEYEAQVKSLCPGGEESDYSENIIFTTQMVSSTNELDDLQNWNVYPNPFNGTLYVEFNFEKTQSKINVEIIDQIGRTVRNKELKNTPVGNHRIQLNGADFTDGIYFIRMTDEKGKSISQKILRSGN